MIWHIVYLSYESRPGGRNYIGKHSTDNLYDGYLGSFSDESFNPDSRIVLGVFNTSEAAILSEIQWQRALQVVSNPDFVNKSYQTSKKFDTTGIIPHNKGKPRTEEEKRKISERTKQALRDRGFDNSGDKNPMYGVKGENHPCFGKECSSETRRKISEANIGKKHSEETKRAMSLARMGNQYRKGKRDSPETIQKRAQALRGRKRGPHTEESKRKMSETKKKNFQRRKEMANAIAPKWMTEEALHTLSSGYLVPGETPKDMIMRLASTASKINQDPTLEEDLKYCLWEGWIGPASPILSNLGTNRGLPISCFSIHISDSVASIYSHLKEAAQLSKNGGGVGVYYGDIRPAGAPFSSGGTSIGVVPWAQQYDLCSRIVSQGGVRRGSFANYLPISHPDVPELLRAKDHSKGDPRKFLDGNVALTISDDWVESMISGDRDKQELFSEVLKTRLMTGSPYLIFIDNANRQNPDCYLERGLSVKTSNLCFTGDTLAVLESGETVTLEELAKDSSAKYHVACSDVEHDYFADRDVRSNVEGGSFATAFRTRSGKIVKIYLEDGGSFRCTPDHLLATQSGQWREAQASLGDVLYTQDGKGVRVIKVEDAGFEENLYCLNVDIYHNFFIKVSDTANIAVRNCSEIFLHTDEHHSFVCVLSSLNLSKYDEYKDWVSPISGRTVPQIGIHFLEAVVSEFIRKAKDKVGMGRSVRFAEKSRALGLGVMGLHTLYQKRGIPFESPEARALNIEAHQWIRSEAEIASRELAETFGEPEWCKGSGMRHSHLLAIAPTRTNSVISGAFSQGIEPIDSNFFVAKQAKGTYVRKNPVLEQLFCERKVGPEVWDQIKENKGSVQNLDCLTDHEKEVFKTAREINQFELIKQAADRQPFVCQGQSLNLFVDPEADAAYLMRLHLSAWKMGLKSLYYLKSSSLLTKKSAPAATEGSLENLMITKDGCPWCVKLKDELKKDGVSFKEVAIEDAKNSGLWKSDWRTVPQLRLKGAWVGGYTDYIDFKSPEEEVQYGECLACEA